MPRKPKKMSLKVSHGDGDVGYLRLPSHPEPGTYGCVQKTVRLRDLMEYDGPDLYLDFDDKNQLIGVEILI